MENTTIEQPSELKLAPILDNAIDIISTRCQPADPTCTELKYVKLDDCYVASRLSQLYHYCRLSKKHRGAMRILSTSKAVRADDELTKQMNELHELSGYDLASGDPGLHYLNLKKLDGLKASQIPSESCFINLESDQEWENLFRVMSEYSFYTNRKKRFPKEFPIAEAEMKVVVEKYKIVGRFSWNAFVDKTTRPKKAKQDTNFLNKY